MTDPELAEACDGLHDEGTPAQYLCTRCTQRDEGDLVEPDDELDDERPSEEEEMH